MCVCVFVRLLLCVPERQKRLAGHEGRACVAGAFAAESAERERDDNVGGRGFCLPPPSAVPLVFIAVAISAVESFTSQDEGRQGRDGARVVVVVHGARAADKEEGRDARCSLSYAGSNREGAGARHGGDR